MAHGSVQNAEQYHPLNTEPALEHCNTHLLWKSKIANRCWPSQLTVLSTLPSTSLACGPSSLDVLRKESKVLTCEAVCITCHLSSFEHCHHPRLPTIKSPTAAYWDLYIFLYPANCKLVDGSNRGCSTRLLLLYATTSMFSILACGDVLQVISMIIRLVAVAVANDHYSRWEFGDTRQRL